jgi:hypothetical protein
VSRRGYCRCARPNRRIDANNIAYCATCEEQIDPDAGAIRVIARAFDRGVRLAPESVDTVARRIADLLRASHELQGGPEPRDTGLVSAEEVGRRYGKSARWARENKVLFEAVPLGKGTRPRLGFDLERVEEVLRQNNGVTRPRKAKPRKARSKPADVELLPIHRNKKAA